MEKADDCPIESAEFAELMATLGPFESNPLSAIACSGGADSMALTILAHDWAQARGGAVTALIVDHGIRSDSALEAQNVAAILRNKCIPTAVLPYKGPLMKGAVQAAARQARYTLLADWCIANSCLHLFIAHHLEDQAETILLRLARGSGLDGLSGMATVTESRNLRILRPFLGLSTERLRSTLNERRICHVNDPSNDDPTFARVRIRALKGTLSVEGMTPRRLAATTARNARARSALESNVAVLLAQTAVLHPQGYAILDPKGLVRAPEEIGLRALSRLLICISGGSYPPRLKHIEGLYDWIQSGMPDSGRTMAGCRILRREKTLLICREPAAAKETVVARGDVIWDNRFKFRFGRVGKGEIRCLGQEGWRAAIAMEPKLRSTSIPSAVRPSLPAFWTKEGLQSVPHLGFYKREVRPRRPRPISICFTPRQPLIPARFTLQKGRYTLSNC